MARLLQIFFDTPPNFAFYVQKSLFKSYYHSLIATNCLSIHFILLDKPSLRETNLKLTEIYGTFQRLILHLSKDNVPLFFISVLSYCDSVIKVTEELKLVYKFKILIFLAKELVKRKYRLATHKILKQF